MSVAAGSRMAKPGPTPHARAAAKPVDRSGSTTKVRFVVNGTPVELVLDPRTTLLDALREHLRLSGTKKGCDHGQCGACTVLVGGRRIDACLTFAVMHEGDEITTIEGLGAPDRLHPMQAAFLEYDGFQCGYCTPGQICSAVGMLAEAGGAALTDDEIRERMSGNLCRCSAYPNIIAAIRRVVDGGAR
jgi:xanthine dehydrogenase YagT iron-sulfur-binding subunit